MKLRSKFVLVLFFLSFVSHAETPLTPGEVVALAPQQMKNIIALILNGTAPEVAAAKVMPGASANQIAAAAASSNTLYLQWLKWLGTPAAVLTMLLIDTGSLNAAEPINDPPETVKVNFWCNYKLKTPKLGSAYASKRFTVINGPSETASATKPDPSVPGNTLVSCSAACSYAGVLDSKPAPAACTLVNPDQRCPDTYDSPIYTFNWIAKTATTNTKTLSTASGLSTFCQNTAPRDLAQQCQYIINERDPLNQSFADWPVTFRCKAITPMMPTTPSAPPTQPTTPTMPSTPTAPTNPVPPTPMPPT